MSQVSNHSDRTDSDRVTSRDLYAAMATTFGFLVAVVVASMIDNNVVMAVLLVLVVAVQIMYVLMLRGAVRGRKGEPET